MSDEKKAPAGIDEYPLWLVIVGDTFDPPPRRIKCETAEAFEKALKENVLDSDQELYAFAFQGEVVPIGALQPVGSYSIGGKVIQVGKAPPAFDDSGHIVPLTRKPGG